MRARPLEPTIEAIDLRLRDYCERHGIDPRRLRAAGWLHPQLTRLLVARTLLAQGRAVPPDVLTVELEPISVAERYERANARRAQMRGA